MAVDFAQLWKKLKEPSTSRFKRSEFRLDYVKLLNIKKDFQVTSRKIEEMVNINIMKHAADLSFIWNTAYRLFRNS